MFEDFDFDFEFELDLEFELLISLLLLLSFSFISFSELNILLSFPSFLYFILTYLIFLLNWTRTKIFFLYNSELN